MPGLSVRYDNKSVWAIDPEYVDHIEKVQTKFWLKLWMNIFQTSLRKGYLCSCWIMFASAVHFTLRMRAHIFILCMRVDAPFWGGIQKPSKNFWIILNDLNSNWTQERLVHNIHLACAGSVPLSLFSRYTFVTAQNVAIWISSKWPRNSKGA